MWQWKSYGLLTQNILRGFLSLIQKRNINLVMKERGSEGWEIIKKKQTFLDKINQKSLLTSFDVKIFSE